MRRSTVQLITVDFLVLTSLDQLVLKLKTLFTLLQKATLMGRSTVLTLPLLLVFSG